MKKHTLNHQTIQYHNPIDLSTRVLQQLIFMLLLGLGFSTNAQNIRATANEVFFHPNGRLQTVANPDSTGTALNANVYMDHVRNWVQVGDALIWGIETTEPGYVYVSPFMNVPESQAGSQIAVSLDDHIKYIDLTSTGGDYGFQQIRGFYVSDPGIHTIKLELLTPMQAGEEVGKLKYCNLVGSAVPTAELKKIRWRPAAAYGSFKSSGSSQNIIRSVHEVRCKNKELDVYFPIRTGFGYTGGVWSGLQQSFTGLNFSLWSYSAGSPEPPIEELSHLTAVGKGLYIGDFSHEGTGVKPRGANPYENSDTDKYIISLNVEKDGIYDYYCVYYLDPESESEWHLFGCGKRYNPSPEIAYLNNQSGNNRLNTFVEVAGNAYNQRTNHYMRDIEYGGWVMDDDGSWHVIDEMTYNGNDASQNTYHNWGTRDNKFYIQAGGFDYEVIPGGQEMVDNNQPLPYYLQGAYLDQLSAKPAAIEAGAPVEITDNSAILSLICTDLGENAVTTLFWGTTEGLTFSDRWEHSELVTVQEGANELQLTDLLPETNYYYRVRVQNDDGEIWLFNTQTFTTAGVVPATCNDFMQNGDETGLDCGGTSCDACPCPEAEVYGPFREDFDSWAHQPKTRCIRDVDFSYYSWYNLENTMEGEDTDWRVIRGNAPTSYTGPVDDFTAYNNEKKYLFLKGGNSNGCMGLTATITSPCISLEDFIATPYLHFAYFMHSTKGETNAELHVDIIAGGYVHEDITEPVIGNHGDLWNTRLVDLTLFHEYLSGTPIQIRFRGTTSSTNKAHIAIDDVGVFNIYGPTCNTGIQDGLETGIDCGGPACVPCDDGSNRLAAPGTPANSEVATQDLRVYPNPVQNYLTLQFNELSSGSFVIYDLMGTNMLQGEINGYRKEVDVARLPAGTYCLVFYGAGQEIITKRFVKLNSGISNRHF